MKRNTEERWGSVSIGLHWTIAFLIVVLQVPVGLIMTSLDQGTLQNVLFTAHKMIGLAIFMLAVFRLAWRWSHPVPALPADLPDWQAPLARANHALLYIVLFAMPITGYLYTALGGFPVPFFGLFDLGGLVPANKPWADVFEAAHVYLQFVLYAVAALHVAGALHHHFLRQDGVLLRMMSSQAPATGACTSQAAGRLG